MGYCSKVIFGTFLKTPVFGTLNSAISNFQTWFVRTVMEILKYCWMYETSNMQCNYNSFIQIINFHGRFRNALRCWKSGACRILVPLRCLGKFVSSWIYSWWIIDIVENIIQMVTFAICLHENFSPNENILWYRSMFPLRSSGEGNILNYVLITWLCLANRWLVLRLSHIGISHTFNRRLLVL